MRDDWTRHIRHRVVGAFAIAGDAPPLNCFAAVLAVGLRMKDPLRGFEMAEDARKAHAGNCKTTVETTGFSNRQIFPISSLLANYRGGFCCGCTFIASR